MSNRWLPLAAIGASVILWSSAYVLSGWALNSGSPAVVSVVRFGLALIVLIPLAARRPEFLRTLRRPRTILLGLTGVAFYYSLANIGMLFTTSGTAALAGASLPVTTAIAAVVIIRERLSTRTWIALGVATFGVALVAASGLHVDVGVLLNVVALTSYALYTVLLRRNGTEEGGPDAIVLATTTGIWGTAIMLPWLGWEALTGTASVPTDLRGMLSVLALAFIVTAPTLVLYNYGAERLPAAISGVATAVVPALGYGFALLVGEPFDVFKALGGVLALVGVVIATIETPSVEPSPPGSALPEPAELATGAIHLPHPPPRHDRSGDPPRYTDHAEEPP